MGLPFESREERNKRKYQCFVCGVQFKTFMEYKDHIIDEHEEGREYVKCPLGRCSAPVRDIRSHFKAIHPKEKMPKVPQIKAMIWKDFGPKGKGKAKKGGLRNKEGWHDSSKMKRKFFHRSKMEKTVFECLDELSEVSTYDVEPFQIEYIHQGKSHNYTPDVLVKFEDGHTELWEVKPSSQTHLEQNQDKWLYARKACTVRGWDFVVVNEKIIDKLKMQVRQQLRG